MHRRLAPVLVLALAPALAATLVPASARAGSPDPFGVWNRGDGNARVRIAPCDDKICAVNLWIGDTSGGEAVGDRLVLALQPQDADTLAGTAYDPQRDLTYSMRMTVGKDQLETRGCILGGLICRSVSWSRVE
ncbi:DUF2147 domain-containing protein [Ancylobacter mangrovi]|uniref:DUF2147 domain-containing protein n=1 Tax=Ancylobacter mangrovi TaxID=2972472 RepID=UPI00216263A9|nr:DUF2147 domain-containing protein [Ancylobacter mangrovi]MCS0503284.1 DUF2147 domain-containing protein [Ancylobacter mangrovi]